MAQSEAVIWGKIESGLDVMMNHMETGISYPKYMEMYTAIYNYCTTTKMPAANNGRGNHLGSLVLTFFRCKPRWILSLRSFRELP